MRNYLALILLAMIFKPAAADLVLGAGEGRSFDGRFNKKCEAWEYGSETELCTLSFYRLLARPEDYHNKMVKVTAYLSYDAGDVAAYPSKERYDAGATEDSIIVIDADIPKDIEKEMRRKNGVYVTMLGEFDARFEGKFSHRSGLIKKAGGIYRSRHMRLSNDMP